MLQFLITCLSTLFFQIEIDVAQSFVDQLTTGRRMIVDLNFEDVFMFLLSSFKKNLSPIYKTSMFYGTKCWVVKSQQEHELSVAEMMLCQMSGHTRPNRITNLSIIEKEWKSPIEERMVGLSNLSFVISIFSVPHLVE